MISILHYYKSHGKNLPVFVQTLIFGSLVKQNVEHFDSIN